MRSGRQETLAIDEVGGGVNIRGAVLRKKLCDGKWWGSMMGIMHGGVL